MTTGLVTFHYSLVNGTTKVYTRKQKTVPYGDEKPYTLGLVNAYNPTRILNMTRSQFAKSLLEPRAGYAPVILPVEWIDDTHAVLRYDPTNHAHLTVTTVTL